MRTVYVCEPMYGHFHGVPRVQQDLPQESNDWPITYPLSIATADESAESITLQVEAALVVLEHLGVTGICRPLNEGDQNHIGFLVHDDPDRDPFSYDWPAGSFEVYCIRSVSPIVEILAAARILQTSPEMIMRICLDNPYGMNMTESDGSIEYDHGNADIYGLVPVFI